MSTQDKPKAKAPPKVPISDIGTATFLSSDKAILFMRYIRKHLELIEEAKK